MRFRLGLLIGMGIGYVLGAKAGRQRYEQINAQWRKLTRSEPAQQLSAELRAAADRAGHTLEGKASEGVIRVTQMVKGGTGQSPPP